MVVRWRPEPCASTDRAAINHEETKMMNTETQRFLRVLRTFVVLAVTSSFYFAHCGAGDDDRECEKEQRGRDLPEYPIGVKSWDHVTDALKRRNVPGAHQNREENTGERPTGNQSRAEQCAGTQFGFLRLPGPLLDPRAHQTASEDRRGRRDWKIGADGERKRPDAAQLERN